MPWGHFWSVDTAEAWILRSVKAPPPPLPLDQKAEILDKWSQRSNKNVISYLQVCGVIQGREQCQQNWSWSIIVAHLLPSAAGLALDTRHLELLSKPDIDKCAGNLGNWPYSSPHCRVDIVLQGKHVSVEERRNSEKWTIWGWKRLKNKSTFKSYQHLFVVTSAADQPSTARGFRCSPRVQTGTVMTPQSVIRAGQRCLLTVTWLTPAAATIETGAQNDLISSACIHIHYGVKNTQ